MAGDDSDIYNTAAVVRKVVISTGQVTTLAGGGSSSFKDLTDENVFSLEARKEAGTQLRKIQRGDDLDDWKPFDDAGAGTKEIRIKLTDGAFRVMCVAKFPEAVYVLHCFKKKTQKTSQHDADLAKRRYKAIIKKGVTMSIETKSMHVTPVGGNIFADLGFEPKEAARLLAETDRAISEKLGIKESLMTELAVSIDAKKLKQAEAAEILGVTRPRVSD